LDLSQHLSTITIFSYLPKINNTAALAEISRNKKEKSFYLDKLAI